MLNSTVQDATASRPFEGVGAGDGAKVPLWKIRAMIRKLKARAEVLDQQISELEWTSQLDGNVNRRKPTKCNNPTILHRDTASMAMIRDRFLPKKRAVL